jgi:hypothetical protein
MTVTSSFSSSATFTRTDAAYLAAKVGTDLYQCHRRYDRPSEGRISEYIDELEELLVGGFVARYEFGFLASGRRRVVSWSYTVTAAGLSGGGDDRPGGVFLAADVTAASWFNYLTRSQKWWELSDSGRADVNARLPFTRSYADEPVDGDGYWVMADRTYSAAGVEIPRRTFRPY